MPSCVAVDLVARDAVKLHQHLVAVGVVGIGLAVDAVIKHRFAVGAEIGMLRAVVVVVEFVGLFVVAIAVGHWLVGDIEIGPREAIAVAVVCHAQDGPSRLRIDDVMSVSVLRGDEGHVAPLVVVANAHRHHQFRVSGVSVDVEERLLHNLAHLVVDVQR